jgi:hypothetical protein
MIPQSPSEPAKCPHCKHKDTVIAMLTNANNALGAEKQRQLHVLRHLYLEIAEVLLVKREENKEVQPGG